MIREVIHDPVFLGMKSEPATKEDLPTARDLLDTLRANSEACVGMAANMIGERKRIIVFDNEGSYMTMFNPEILKTSGPYDAEEGCLSLLGGPRPCKRYQSIKVRWQNEQFQTRIILSTACHKAKGHGHGGQKCNGSFHFYLQK